MERPPDPHEIDDDELVVGMMEKDERYLTWAWQKYGAKVRGVLYGNFRDKLSESDIEETVGTTFYKAYRGAGTFDDNKGASLGAWLSGIAYKAAIDMLRGKNPLETALLEDVDINTLPDASSVDVTDPQTEALYDDLRSIIDKHLD